jgi:transaldolase/fructose-6-phosphate aldolase-like protein
MNVNVCDVNEDHHRTQPQPAAASGGWRIRLAGHAVRRAARGWRVRRADLPPHRATSNPTIFTKAITDSDRYDRQLRNLAAGGERDTQELFFALALDGIRAGARWLHPAYEDGGGGGGFISFECTPDLADDTEATIAQATSLWQRLGQPNVMMIKVPGTAARLPAIEERTRRGLNMNITLLFSIGRYEQVIDADLRGLSARANAGEPVDKIASVALVLPVADRHQDRHAARGGLARPRPGRARQRPHRLSTLAGKVHRPRLGTAS